MSDQELASAMNIETTGEEQSNVESAEANSTPQMTFVTSSECTKIYDYVCSHLDIVSNWKKVNISLSDGTQITNTQEVLVGVDSKNIPLSFACKNLLIPNSVLNNVSDIRVYVSGIIITSPNYSIYVSKNNIFIYVKNESGYITESYVYYKLRGDKVSYKVNQTTPDTPPSSERAKLEFKVSGGRIYNIIQNMTDTQEIRTAILTFLKDKVVDINYCIKIENLCQRCSF